MVFLCKTIPSYEQVNNKYMVMLQMLVKISDENDEGKWSLIKKINDEKEEGRRKMVVNQEE
ncbi:hypothetical protein [Bacillus sp. NTK034]|uniref:hypothetical protein n=1 Tax=Bacillus sp. NTK034 TaxID=2802176 RepID=UPI001A8E4516|nr:hypothetical protein [Bacillus sp. NTK034]MBN8202998.1 hypothetical protein [Bacillus sp. NTK034]